MIPTDTNDWIKESDWSESAERLAKIADLIAKQQQEQIAKPMGVERAEQMAKEYRETGKVVTRLQDRLAEPRTKAFTKLIEVRIAFDRNKQTFVASSPDLPNVIGTGPTREGALDEMEILITEALLKAVKEDEEDELI